MLRLAQPSFKVRPEAVLQQAEETESDLSSDSEGETVDGMSGSPSTAGDRVQGEDERSPKYSLDSVFQVFTDLHAYIGRKISDTADALRAIGGVYGGWATGRGTRFRTTEPPRACFTNASFSMFR
jgi:hypothetical protein